MSGDGSWGWAGGEVAVSLELARMLAIQAADCMLYLPEGEVASLTPVYPDRWRVVTCEGRVGHVPRLSDTRSWVALGSSWVSPRWLRREGDFWRDPAGFLYPYQELAEAEVVEESAHGIRWISHVKQKAVWATDDGEVDCELKFSAALAAYSELIRIGCGFAASVMARASARSCWIRVRSCG